MAPAPACLNGREISAVILDFGEVLSYPPAPHTLAAMADLLHITPEKFRGYYYAERYPYDRGELSAQEYWTAVARDAGTQLSPEQIEWLRRTDVAMWSNVNPQMLCWAGRLRAEGLQTAVLSNMHADMAAAVRSDFAWISDFRCFVLSAELGFAKPDPQIFQHCLACLNVAADAALFIDDKERNTRAAEELDIAGICANSPEAIREKLKAAGWNASLPE
jgi:putative hydrolase of the HAD superfamily